MLRRQARQHRLPNPLLAFEMHSSPIMCLTCSTSISRHLQILYVSLSTLHTAYYCKRRRTSLVDVMVYSRRLEVLRSHESCFCNLQGKLLLTFKVVRVKKELVLFVSCRQEVLQASTGASAVTY